MFSPNIAIYSFFNELYKTTNDSITKIYSFLNPKIIIIKSFILYSEIKSKYENFQETNLFFKKIGCFTNYAIQNIYGIIFNVRREPFYENWINTSILSHYEKRTILENNHSYLLNFGFEYNENYYNNEDWSEKLYLDSFKTTCIHKSSKMDFNEKINKEGEKITNEEFECIMILKTENKYIVRIINDTCDNYIDSEDQSKTHFLSVEYTNPKMNKSINIDIDKKYFIEGNQLFSPTFVLRCLEYQKGILNNNSIFNINNLKEYFIFNYLFKLFKIEEPYYFDMNYKLNIMDNNIHFFEINSNEYIVVEKDGYKVKKIHS